MKTKHLPITLASVCLLICTAVAAVQSQTGAKVNLSGTWSFEVETSAGSGSPTFTFKQEGERLIGQYKGAFGEAPVSGEVKGNEVRFTLTVDAQGSNVTITYRGTAEQDSMKGTLQAGDLASGTWKAKRQQQKEE